MFRNSCFAQFACWMTLIAVSSVAPGASARPPEDDAKSRRSRRVIMVHQDAGPRWVGVGFDAIPDVLRAHIDLEPGQGLMVTQVVPGSPAEKAGLAVHDILLNVNGQPLKSPEALVEAVAEAGADGIQVQWLHQGETRTEVLLPAKRPGQVDLPVPHLPSVDITKEFKWNGRDFTVPFGMRLFGRAYEVPTQAKRVFPKGLKIEVKKEGSGPARIVIERGDQRWEISDQELDQLPADVRLHVERFAGVDLLIDLPRVGEEMQLPNAEMMDEESAIEFFSRPQTRRFFRRLAPFDVEKRLDVLDRRMQQLRDELRQLRGADDASEDGEPDADPGETESEDSDAGESNDDRPEKSDRGVDV